MKTVVFYDLENLGIPIRNGEFERMFTGLTARIRQSPLVGDVALQRAYISKARSSELAHIRPVMEKLGVELVAVEPFSAIPSKKKANLVDFKMVVDVVAAVAVKRSVTTVAIASGDSDFGFLCQKIKELGKNLVVISQLAITGDAMIALCDDWINLSGQQALQPKYILKLIDARVEADYRGEPDFFASLGNFLGKLERDYLLRRCMAEWGLPAPVFIELLHRRGIAFPRHERLGYTNVTAFLSILLRDASFHLSGNNVRYRPDSKTPSLYQLASGLLGVPAGYSRDKLFRYHDVVSGVEDVDELVTYIGFMKRSGMIGETGLCKKRTFRAAIRAHLRRVLAAAGIELDKKTLAELEKKL